MPPPKADAGLDFAAVLNAAMRPPESAADFGKDLPDGFPLPIGATHKMVDTADQGIPGLVAYDFKVRRKVFTIFRPWDSCSRCTADLSMGKVSPPDEGDYYCPHITLNEYESIVNDVLSGKLIFGSEQEVTQKDGTILVSLRWYEKIAKKKKKQQPGEDGTLPEPPI